MDTTTVNEADPCDASGPAAEQAVVESPDAAGGPPNDPRDGQIAALTAERDALREQLLRVMAEAQNVQKRLRAQAEEDRKFAALPLVEQLVPVLDNLDRSLEAAEAGASLEKLLEGVRGVERQLRRALEAVSVVRVASVGHPFDPDVHEALAELPTLDHPEDTVTDEIEAGYTMHGRVVRPARVRVAKRPS